MEPTRNESSGVWRTIKGIGRFLRFAVVAFVIAILFLVAGLIALSFFSSRYPGPVPSFVGLLGYVLIPLSVVGGLVAASKPPHARLLTRRRIVVTCLIVVATALALRQYVRSLDWALIVHSTNLQQAEDASGLSMYSDSSFGQAHWLFAHFKIPRQQVSDFVAANQCEPTDKTSLRRQHSSIPEELQSLPASGNRFYKEGRTRVDLPFDMLVDDEGTVLMFLDTPD